MRSESYHATACTYTVVMAVVHQSNDSTQAFLILRFSCACTRARSLSLSLFLSFSLSLSFTDLLCACYSIRVHRHARVSPTHYPAIPIPATKLKNSNGAGDTFVGAVAAAIVTGMDVDAAVQCGLRAAALTMTSDHAVSHDLSHSVLAPH